jgi:hypothetical protein
MFQLGEERTVQYATAFTRLNTVNCMPVQVSVAGFIDDDQYKWLLPESLMSALNKHGYSILCYQQLSTHLMECFFQEGLL